jgi:malonyl-CoA O-methyltransferase
LKVRGEASLVLESQAAYALWADTYSPYPHNALMSLEQQTLLSMLPEVAGSTVLDAGCGTGRYLRLLRERGAKAIGVDLSAPMLARAHAGGGRVARGNICALPIDSTSVDVVVSGLALGDVPDLELALAEMARVLRPGGCVVYSVVHPIGDRAGWSRTFTAGGRQHAIATYWHSLDEHRRACADAGLRLTGWLEPVLPEVPQHPAVLVVRAARATTLENAWRGPRR